MGKTANAKYNHISTETAILFSNTELNIKLNVQIKIIYFMIARKGLKTCLETPA
jgi:hypothetical protein